MSNLYYLITSFFKTVTTTYRSHQLGFTLIELLLVVSITTIVAAASTPFLSRFILVNSLNTTQKTLSSMIKKSQAYAMQGKDNQTWGVCFDNQILTLFSGSCNSPSYSENFAVPSSITLTGLNTITFNTKGEPDQEVSITIQSAIQSQTFDVNSLGAITAQLAVLPSPNPSSSPTPSPSSTPTVSPTPTPSATPTPSPSPSPSPSPTPSPSPDTSSLTSVLNVYIDWGSGFCARLEITNPTNSIINNWTAVVNRVGYTIYESWNALFVENNDSYVVTPEEWTSSVNANATNDTVGFCANKDQNYQIPSIQSTSHAAPTPTPAPNSLTGDLNITSEWESGFCVDVVITNPTNQDITGWNAIINRTSFTIYNNWSSTYQESSSQYSISPISWNETVPANSSINSAGFCANKNSGYTFPTILEISN